MKLKRSLLQPFAHVAALHAAAQLKAFMRAHERTAEVQQELLRVLVRRSGQTGFGRDHGLASIRSYEDFVKAVPVRSYEGLGGYLRRVYEGDTQALLPAGERVWMFSLTSGTTGEPKRIPVTGAFLDEMRRGSNVFGMRVLQDHPDVWLRNILQISSPMWESRSPGGLPCGAISGLMMARQKWIVRRMYPAPEAVLAIPDPGVRNYTILRSSVASDVAVIITPNPSSTIKLIETGQAHADRLVRDVHDGTFTPPADVPDPLRAALRFRRNPRLARRMARGIGRDGTLLPVHFWKVSVLMNWTGGTLGLYLPRLAELFPGAAIRDVGLLASEGRFSVPLEDGTARGVAEIMGNFLEFIPAEHRESANLPVLRAHELEIGEEYFLVVTNFAGLWRYDMDDRVRVTGMCGQSPVFEFLSRGSRTASMTGEKITEHQVVEAMGRACRELGVDIALFEVQGRFAATPFYELRMEALPACPSRRVADRLDAQLRALNIEYASKRKSGRLGGVRAVELPEGAFARAEARRIRARNGRSEQYKHQYLIAAVLKDEAGVGERVARAHGAGGS